MRAELWWDCGMVFNQIHSSQMFELWSFPLLYPEVCWKKDLYLIFLYLTSMISVHKKTKKQKIRVLISVFIKQHRSTSCSAHLQRRTLLREIDTVLDPIASQRLIIAACHDSCISGGSTAARTDVTLFSFLSITVMVTWRQRPRHSCREPRAERCFWFSDTSNRFRRRIPSSQWIIE